MTKGRAKTPPEFLKNSVIYQINLRAFTPGGTLRSAERLLPHIASLGADLVYLCPIFLADDDPREEFWSDRQKRSGSGNPQNMYRMKDYYAVDPEYGTDADLKSFVRTAHENGLRVPPLDILKLLAEFYDTSLDYLVGMTDCPEKYPFASAEMYLLFATCQDMASPALNEVLSYACYRKQMEKH